MLEIMKTEGRDGLAKILKKDNPLAQACGLFLPKQNPKK
jgi:hypothetical protein